MYAQRPFAGPAQVLEYLGRYTHRVAISNERLVSLDDGIVRFRWKDYADGDRVKLMELTAEEFIRRFLLHDVPTASSASGTSASSPIAPPKRSSTAAGACWPSRPLPRGADTDSVRALMLRLTGIDIERCPVCQRGRLRVTEILPPLSRPARPAPIWDTS